MRLSEINKPHEQYVLEENVSNIFDEIYKNAKAILVMVDNDRPSDKVNSAIEGFLNKYLHQYGIIRTIIAYDDLISDEDENRPSIVGIRSLARNSSVEEVKEELEIFFESVIKKNPKLHATYNQFVKYVSKLSNKSYSEYKGVDAIKEIVEMLEYIKSKVQNLVKANEDIKESSITKIISEMIEAGFEYNELKESTQTNEDQFYMIVDMKLYDDNKSSKIPSANFKNLLITKSRSPSQARKNLRKHANRSLRELNKQLKEKGMRVEYANKNCFDKNMVYKGYDNIKKKNIKALTGSDVVSTGIVVLKGLSTSGNTSTTPEYAPNRYALFNSKSSITRYINKQFPKED